MPSFSSKTEQKRQKKRVFEFKLPSEERRE